jgi:GntR family transcriptional regulator
VDTVARRTPQYLRIYRDLRAKIEQDSFSPGERLPAQRELAETYGVTVMTVRQALRLLEQEEIVTVQHGLGTFVAPTRVRFGLLHLLSLAQEVASQGLEVTTRILRSELVEPHPHVAEQLALEPGDPVYVVERLRFLGSAPIMFQRSSLPPSVAEELEAVDMSQISLYGFLHERLGIGHARESIHAINLPPTEAMLLEDQPGAAALLSERLTFSASDEPILLDRACMRGDRISMSTDRLFADAAGGYTLNFGAGGAMS